MAIVSAAIVVMAAVAHDDREVEDRVVGCQRCSVRVGASVPVGLEFALELPRRRRRRLFSTFDCRT